MPLLEDTTALERSFQRTTALLEQLLLGLQARRTAWISARPTVLQPSAELEQLTQQIAGEEAQRDELIARLRDALPAPPGGPRNDLHVNVSAIAAASPSAVGKTLREAAKKVTALAKAVRTEVTMGQRLLRFAQRAQEEVTVALGGATRREGQIPGYDRQARFVRRTNASGAIVDGRM